MSALGWIAALVVAAAPPSEIQKSEAYQQQMSEAIQRHDSGDYAGAISIYRSMLKTWPHEPVVVHEISLSMSAAGTPPDELIAFIEGELKVIKKPSPQTFSTLAGAFDAKGQLAKGESTLRKGLKLDDKNADLHFNLGINLAMQNRMKDAEGELKVAIELEPRWPSPWRAAGMALRENGKTLDAFLSLGRFVLLEPNTKRGPAAAQLMVDLIAKNISRNDAGIQVSVNGGSSGDLAMMLTAAAAASSSKNESETFVKALKDYTHLAAEQGGFAASAATIFADAEKAKCLDAAAWEVLRVAGDPVATRWFSTHAEEEARFEKFIAKHRSRR